MTAVVPVDDRDGVEVDKGGEDGSTEEDGGEEDVVGPIFAAHLAVEARGVVAC